MAYAGPEGQWLVPLELDEGATVAMAVAASGIIRFITPATLGTIDYGVYGRLRRPDEHLADGDRVELCRPLLADPMTQRRLRARRTRPPER